MNTCCPVSWSRLYSRLAAFPEQCRSRGTLQSACCSSCLQIQLMFWFRERAACTVSRTSHLLPYLVSTSTLCPRCTLQQMPCMMLHCVHAVRRKRRLYESQDIRELVLDEAADCCRAGAPDVTAAIAGRSAATHRQRDQQQQSQQQQQRQGLWPQQELLRPQEPFFPLEVFDDTTFESRRPLEWVPKAQGEVLVSRGQMCF